MKTEEKSNIVVYIIKNEVFFYEYNSKGMIEEIIKQAEDKYGIKFKRKCLSMCG